MVLGKIQFSRRHIFLQVSNRGCPWNRKDVWSAVEEPTQGHLCRSGSKVFANFGKSSLGGSKRRPMLHRVGSQRAIWHERDSLASAINHHGISLALTDAIPVLHRIDPGN